MPLGYWRRKTAIKGKNEKSGKRGSEGQKKLEIHKGVKQCMSLQFIVPSNFKHFYKKN